MILYYIYKKGLKEETVRSCLQPCNMGIHVTLNWVTAMNLQLASMV